MKDGTTFFSHLTHELARVLSSVVYPESKTLFRKHQEIRVGTSGQLSNEQVYLIMTDRIFKESDSGNFYFPVGDKVLKFREPTQVTANFCLFAKGLDTNSQLQITDRLSEFFFDTRSIAAILPEALSEFPPLMNRLQLKKAEVRALTSQPIATANRNPDFSFHFQYSALYHSGNPLRETQKVKSRVLNYNKKEEQRSVP